jgi:hypothetical protein
MFEEAIIRQELPNIETIESYTVGLLKEDLRNNYSKEKDSFEMSENSPLYHVAVMISYKYLKNNKIKLEGFSDFDDDDSGIRLGNIAINQRCLVGLQTALQRRLLRKTSGTKTTFGFKSILDRYKDLEMTVGEQGGIGAAFLNEIRNAIIDEYRQSPYNDLSQNLYKRFKTILQDDKYEFDSSSELYKLKDPKACDSVDHSDNIKKAVNKVEPWYKTNNIYTTKAIERIILLAHCVDSTTQTSLEDVFDQVKLKVRDWLINNPNPLSSISKENQKNSKIDTVGSEGIEQSKFKAKSNYTHLTEFNLDTSLVLIEDWAKEFLDSLDEKEFIILELILGYREITSVKEILDIGDNMVYKKKESIQKKIENFVAVNKLDMEEVEKFIKALGSFLKNAVI